MTARLVELSLNSQLADLLAVRACQYVLYDREPRRAAATGKRRTSRLLLLGHGDGETRRQWRSGVRQPRLPGPATECRSPGDQKQLAADLSHSSASAKERLDQRRSARDRDARIACVSDSPPGGRRGDRSGRISAALSDSPVPTLYLGKAVSSDDRDAPASRARYAGIRARERPLRH